MTTPPTPPHAGALAPAEYYQDRSPAAFVVPVIGIIALPLLLYLNHVPSNVVVGMLCFTSAICAPWLATLIFARGPQLRIDAEGISFGRPLGRRGRIPWEQLLDARVMQRETNHGRSYTLVLDYRHSAERVAAGNRVGTANVMLNGLRCRPEEVLARVATGFQAHLGRPLRAPRFSHLYERGG